MKRFTLTLTASLAFWLCQAQSVELVGGSLSIAPGTTLRLNGPLTLVLQPGTTLINDGQIDLGESASLVEAVGAPIQGSGIEVARIPIDGSLDGSEPGGLGLALSSPSAAGPITIKRGHTPRTFPEGDPSIARWFLLDAPNVTEGTVDLDLRYDPVELNGLSSSNLGLFLAADEIGPWSLLTSSNNTSANTVSATLVAPWAYITAFAADAPTATPLLTASDGLQVWPTLTSGELNVLSKDGIPLGLLEVFDATGRSVMTLAGVGFNIFATMDLSKLSSGTYFLRVGQRSILKIRKAP